RRRPLHPVVGRAAHLELPHAAGRVRRDGLPRPALARLHAARPLARARRLLGARPPLRRSDRRADRVMRRHAAAAVLTVVLGATGCAAGASDARGGFDEAAFDDRWTAAEQGALDYQLGGAYDVADDVTVVVRDREAPPAGVVLDVCYVNAFQTQPGDL